jgi:hypothetical protein
MKKPLTIFAIVLLVVIGAYGIAYRAEKETEGLVPVSDQGTDFPVPATATDGRGLEAFDDPVRNPSVSNVVGYFGYGSFLFYLPDWLSANWISPESSATSTVFVPRETGPRSYSDIAIEYAPSGESYNAYYLYQRDAAAYGVTSENFPNDSGDLIIYHLESLVGDRFEHAFYVDGRGRTAKITFSGDKKDYIVLTQKIKEFVRGLTKGEGPRG